MDKPCDDRTSDGDTNHRIWQEFHTVLWDSVRFYEILRIMVSYGLLQLRLDFKAGFYEVPLGSVVFYLVSMTFFCILLYSFRFRAMSVGVSGQGVCISQATTSGSVKAA